MITAKKVFFIERCNERGYTLDQVKDCIVSENGDDITVDETHPSYPKKSKNAISSPPVSGLISVDTGGTGTELKKILTKIGIKATPNCSCNTRAKIMDEKGADWCENNIDTIVGWLREEIFRL
jgi:hypothetical protein